MKPDQHTRTTALPRYIQGRGLGRYTLVTSRFSSHNAVSLEQHSRYTWCAIGQSTSAPLGRLYHSVLNVDLSAAPTCCLFLAGTERPCDDELIYYCSLPYPISQCIVPMLRPKQYFKAPPCSNPPPALTRGETVTTQSNPSSRSIYYWPLIISVTLIRKSGTQWPQDMSLLYLT